MSSACRTIGEHPPLGQDPFGEAVGVTMFGIPPEPSHDPEAIQGIGAPRGAVQARAKVVRDLFEAGKVHPGDILVCEMTLPAWTHCSR